MPFTIRRIDPQRTFMDHISWDIFAATIPVAAVDAALTATAAHEQRHRRLSMRVIVFLVIAMNIWTHCAIPMVFRHMVRGLRWIWPTDERLPQSNALTYRRYQLGVKPLAWLFHQQCQPLATDTTLSAWLFGLRLSQVGSWVLLNASCALVSESRLLRRTPPWVGVLSIHGDARRLVAGAPDGVA